MGILSLTQLCFIINNNNIVLVFVSFLSLPLFIFLLEATDRTEGLS